MATGKLSHDTQDVQGLVASVISTWRTSGQPKACDVLAKHPSLREHKSAVLDLAHEEYQLRRSKGEHVAPSAFCEQFPGFQKSVRRLLNVHWEWCDDSPEDLEALARECEADLEKERLLHAPIDWPQVGEQYLGFELLEELGKGAFARVYLASETALGGRLVAIKVSRHGTTEAKTLGKLSHPNIVPIHSMKIDPQSQVSVVCMPFLGRATLYDVLDLAFADRDLPPKSVVVLAAAKRGARGRVAPEPWYAERALSTKLNYTDAIVRLGIQLSDALAYTHQKGILHRDIKPSNILLTPQGVPMLLDFNLSWDADAVTSLVGGTVPYMAPEMLHAVIAENPATVAADSRADVFSLGAILYELLFGVPPFGDPDLDFTEAKSQQLHRAVTYVLDRQKKGPPTRNRTNEHCDNRLFAIIANCLAWDVADRPQTAAELADELREYSSFQNRARRYVRQHRSAVATVSSIAATIVLAFGIFLATRPSYAVREYRQGVQALEAKNFSEAAKHFRWSLEDQPNDFGSRFGLVQALLKQGDLESAEQELRILLRNLPDGHPFAGKVYAQIGFVKADRGANPPAILALKNAIKFDCTSADVFNNLGACYIGLSSLDEAIDTLDLAIKSNPQLQAARINRAIARLNKANQSIRTPKEALDLTFAAIEDIESAIEAGPRHSELHYWAAFAFANANRLDPNAEAAEQARVHVVKSLTQRNRVNEIRELIIRFPDFLDSREIQALLERNEDKPESQRFPRIIPPDVHLNSD